MNNLPKVVMQHCLKWDMNPRPTDRKSNALPVALPRHLYMCNLQKRLQTFCGGTLKAFVLRSTLVHVSMHGRTTIYPIDTHGECILTHFKYSTTKHTRPISHLTYSINTIVANFCQKSTFSIKSIVLASSLVL